MAHGPDPSPSFHFQIKIQGVEVARFSEASGLEFESETMDYQEGGLHTSVHRFPGRFKFTNLTLKKGIATDGNTLWAWVKKMVKGQIEPHDVTVTLLNMPYSAPVRSWTFQQAYPIKWSASALSADQSAIAIETLTLAHQGMLLE